MPSTRSRRVFGALFLTLGLLPGCTRRAAPPATVSDAEVIRRFHELWYNKFKDDWSPNSWMGVPTAQNPMDVWITQEILTEVKPDFFIEAGSWRGGSALLWATLLEQLNPASRVITIDIEDHLEAARQVPLFQRRVDFLLGSSIDPAIVSSIAKRVRGKKVVILLDSAHFRRHVIQELRLYSPMVSQGSYLIVQDSNINGHPVLPNWADGDGGPMEAIKEFLASNDEFQVDQAREKFLFTFSPHGFLRRVKPPGMAAGDPSASGAPTARPEKTTAH
jgi:cephalosporin hydroxylase